MDIPNSSRFPEGQVLAGRLDGSIAHLTDEQFTEVLLGSTAPEISAHLSACPQCAQEAERVSGAIVSFDRQSGLWAERRAATAERVRVSSRSASWLNRPAGRAAWSAAAAAAVVIAAVMGFVRKDTPVNSDVIAPRIAAVSAAAPAGAAGPVAEVRAVQAVRPEAVKVSPATVKANHDLMMAIDGELQAETAPPASVYGLDEEALAARHKGTKRTTD